MEVKKSYTVNWTLEQKRQIKTTAYYDIKIREKRCTGRNKQLDMWTKKRQKIKRTNDRKTKGYKDKKTKRQMDKNTYSARQIDLDKERQL